MSEQKGKSKTRGEWEMFSRLPSKLPMPLKMTPCEEGTIVHSQPPVMWDQDDAARCSRSLVILVTEPDDEDEEEQEAS